MSGTYEAFFTELNSRSLEVLNRILGVLTYTSEKITEIEERMNDMSTEVEEMHKTLDDLGGKLDGIQAAADSIQGDTAEILSNSSSLSIAAHISEIGGWPTSALAQLHAYESLAAKQTGGAPLLALFEKWASQLPTSKILRRRLPANLGRVARRFLSKASTTGGDSTKFGDKRNVPSTSLNHTPKRTAGQHTLHTSARH